MSQTTNTDIAVLPQHIAIIQDGNRRWASKRGLMPWNGHKEGLNRFREIARAAFDLGIPFVTFWALSIDNFAKRSKAELDFLFSIVKEEFANESIVNDFIAQDVRVRIVGKWRELIPDTKFKDVLEHLEHATKDCGSKNLTVLIAYDGKSEMLDAIQTLPESSACTEAHLRTRLSTGFLPDVDLVIRTGGEPHWSAGFMMWLTANSQFYFTDQQWPDFDSQQFQLALQDYAGRKRRFGS